MTIRESTRDLYETYRATLQKIADIKYAAAVLQWDQETYMPVQGAQRRGGQIATLSEIAHHHFATEELGNLLNDLSGRNDLSDVEKKNIELTLFDYNKNKKYTPSFVRELAEQVNRTFHAWLEARKANQFRVFENELDALVTLKKRETQILGFEKHPYDALLDEFERGCTVAFLDDHFAHLLPQLNSLLERIRKSDQVDNHLLHQHFPKEQQWNWGMYLVEKLGFNLKAGRQDISEHPFTINFSSQDVRITTRIDEHDFSNMTWSCIHETGHALYEQGIPDDQYGLPSGEYASLSIHESQSRLWENNVGRSRAFWQAWLPVLKTHFRGGFDQMDLESFYRAINKVEATPIRTEADELTYHFHVNIRYQLEKQLIGGSLKTADIPAFWNQAYQEQLGLEILDDRSGCLQDVHWSHGSFGYFSTYSLGSLYAAQFFDAARQKIEGLEGLIGQGQTEILLNWLRTNIHFYGRQHQSDELCRKVTGQSLDTSYFTGYLLQKYGDIYNLQTR